MQERYGRDAQQAVDAVVAQARARATLSYSPTYKTAPSVRTSKKRLKDANYEAEGSRQAAENWKGQVMYWEDSAEQAELRLVGSAGNSDTDTPAFSDICASV